MYGGLFSDLPSAKKSKSSDKESSTTAQVDSSLQSSQEKPNEQDDDASKKRPASVISSLGAAGTSMAFVPTALRNRKRAHSASGPNVKMAPMTTTSSSIDVPLTQIGHSKTIPQSIPVSQIHSNQAQKHAAPALEEESETMQQLHASVVDTYDPLVPNDLLAYWDRKAMERERLELEREAKETLERQERLRLQLEQERESIAKTGNVQEILQHRQQKSMSMGRGRGRGVNNLPAWLTEKQKKENLGKELPGSQGSMTHECTVILSNLTAPGDIDDDLAFEVKEECEEQCGPVVNVVTKDAKPPYQPLVQVHVQFKEKATAEKAVEVFNGRKFGRRRITAELMRNV